MNLAKQILKTAFILAVVTLAVRGVWAPYSVNLAYFLTAVRVLGGLCMLVDLDPKPLKRATPKWLAWFYWYGTTLILAVHGWWWCAAAFSFAAIGGLVRDCRLEEKAGGAK